MSKGYQWNDEKALEHKGRCKNAVGGPAAEITPSKTAASGTRSEYILTCSLCSDDLERIGLLLKGAGCEYSIARRLKNVLDTEQPLFRFELFFDGEYQAVGLLQSLDEICKPDVYRRLMKPFKDDLPVPVGIDLPCSFWFTERGLQKFADAIDEINRCISPYRWEARCIVLRVHETNYLYTDNYQVALGAGFVDQDLFTSFSRAADLMDFDAGASPTQQ